MTSPTHYLEIIFLAASMSPTSIVAAALSVKARGSYMGVDAFSLWIYFFVLTVILGLIFALGFRGEPSVSCNRTSLMVGLVFAPLCMGVELLISGAAFQGGRSVRSFQIELNSKWIATGRWHIVLVAALVAICEEIVFRYIWIPILVRVFYTNAFLAVIISAVVFGLNHSTFGSSAVYSKIASGVLYGMLYVYSDYCILPPILAHVAGNVLAIWWLSR